MRRCRISCSSIRSRSRPTARCGHLSEFASLARICTHRATELFTYTYSTAVRSTMLAAGFYVAHGRATGPKNETTVALSPLAAKGAYTRELLGRDWFARWQRSDAKAPLGIDATDESWVAAIEQHPQFRIGPA